MDIVIREILWQEIPRLLEVGWTLFYAVTASALDVGTD